MIIPDSFRRAYEEQYAFWEKVKKEVDGILRIIAERYPGAYTNSRLKLLESTYLKVQKGNAEIPLLRLNDFLGCVLVVPTIGMIPKIQSDLVEYFEIVNHEFKVPDPHSFTYTDLNLGLTLKDSLFRSDKSVLNREFELQIKTLLQAAWSQAEHDIVYKPARISWGNERISAQLRALLALADSILEQIEATAKLLHQQAEQSYDSYMSETKQIISLMEYHWDSDDLPFDKRRMAFIVVKYLRLAKADIATLNSIIVEAKSAEDPLLQFRTLSPMQKIFILLFRVNSASIISSLNSLENEDRVLISEEMEDFYPELRSITSGRMSI